MELSEKQGIRLSRGAKNCVEFAEVGGRPPARGYCGIRARQQLSSQTTLISNTTASTLSKNQGKDTIRAAQHAHDDKTMIQVTNG